MQYEPILNINNLEEIKNPYLKCFDEYRNLLFSLSAKYPENRKIQIFEYIKNTPGTYYIQAFENPKQIRKYLMYRFSNKPNINQEHREYKENPEQKNIANNHNMDTIQKEILTLSVKVKTLELEKENLEQKLKDQETKIKEQEKLITELETNITSLETEIEAMESQVLSQKEISEPGTGINGLVTSLLPLFTSVVETIKENQETKNKQLEIYLAKLNQEKQETGINEETVKKILIESLLKLGLIEKQTNGQETEK